MSVPYEVLLAGESQQTRSWVEQRAAALIAEETNLQEMRRLRKLTQARLSKKLNIGQDSVSRIEKRADLYLSTLRNYVEAVGGKLSLIVEFPDHPPVLLAGLGQAESKDSGPGKASKQRKRKSPGGQAV